MSNPNPVFRFKKGDPRINRKGRPKNFDAARALFLEIGNEVLSGEVKGVYTETTRVQAIIRDWLTSNNFQKQKAAIEYMFGKVPDKTELTGKDGEPITWRQFIESSSND